MQNVNNIIAAKKIITDATLRSVKNGVANIGTRVTIKTSISSSGENFFHYYIDGIETSKATLQARIANELFTVITHKSIDD